MTVYTSTAFDGPSTHVGDIEARGINDTDQIVGWYRDKDGRDHGYIFDANSGTYTTLDDPLHEYLYNPNGGTYTTLDDPLAANGFDNPFAASGTVAEGINAAGQIVGYYADSNDDYHGFLYNGGIYTTLDDPQAFDTYA